MSKEQLLVEAFNVSYPYRIGSRDALSERYYFDAEVYEMEVYVSGFDGPIPVVGFYPSNTFDHSATGSFSKSGINPVKVFSTVMKIISRSRLIQKSEGVFDIEMEKSEKSRISLYRRMATRYAKRVEDLGITAGQHTLRIHT